MFCGTSLRCSSGSMIVIIYTCMAPSDEVYLRMMVTFISSPFRFLFLIFTLIYQLFSFVMISITPRRELKSTHRHVGVEEGENNELNQSISCGMMSPSVFEFRPLDYTSEKLCCRIGCTGVYVWGDPSTLLSTDPTQKSVIVANAPRKVFCIAISGDYSI